MVRASNNDEIWNPKPLSIVVNVIPPFWKMWGFRISSLIFTLILLTITVRYIERNKYRKKLILLEQQAALSRERIRISNDMHDDVGSILTRMSLLLASIKNKKNLAGEEKTVIQKITDANNEVIAKLDEIVWALNPKNDNLKNLSEYLSEYAEEFFEATNKKCRFDFPVEITPHRLSSETRHNIFLVFKEILNNIAKHSGADKVSINLAEYENEFAFTIFDNGKGFDTDKTKVNGNGLKNMENRIERIGGHLFIDSGNVEGTRIVFSIPVKNS